MKKMMLNLLIAAAFMFSISSMAAAPKSTNKDVQKLVIEFAKQALADKIAPVLYPKLTGVPVILLGTKVTYKGLKAKAANDADVKKLVEAIDAEVAKTKMYLSDINTDKVDEKANKTEFSANLTAGKKILLVMYTAQFNKDGKLQVNGVSGLEHIYDKNAAEDLKNVKPLPYSKKAATQLREFRNKIILIQRKRRDEFETPKEFRARINRDKLKAYQSFFKNSIVKQNIFVADCPSDKAVRLYFVMKSTSIQYFELMNLIKSARRTSIANLFLNVKDTKCVAEYDFAGIVKTRKDQVQDYYHFKCTVAEARQIKKNLGNSWNCNVKLWLKLNLYDLRWHIVKVCAIPVKEK